MMEIKIRKNKLEVIGYLNKINKILEVENELYSEVKDLYQYPDSKEIWQFYGYYGILNLISIAMVGHGHNAVYNSFRTTTHQKDDLPVGWYKTEYSLDNDGHIEGPKGYSGFIPDCITDVILSTKLIPEKKYKLLTRMYEDLRKQQHRHKAKHK